MADVTELCLISFERFKIGPDIDRFWNPIGVADFELQNGLTTEHIKSSIFETDLADDGEIDLTKVSQKIRRGTDFDLHGDVAACVKALVQFGWLSPNTQVNTDTECNPEYQAILSVTEWENGPSANDYFCQYPSLFDGIDGSFSDAIAGSLFDAVVRVEGLYSDAWYNALICRIYFSSALDCNINSVANLGRLLEQKKWKRHHEKNAIDAESAHASRMRGSQSNADKKIKRRAYMMDKIIQWETELDFKFKTANSDLAKAKLLLVNGQLEKPSLFMRGDKPISISTIKQDYEDIKSDVYQRLAGNRLRKPV